MHRITIPSLLSLAIVAGPAHAADDIAGATAAIEVACSGITSQTPIEQHQLAEAVLVSAGVLPSQLARAIAARSGGTPGPDELANGALALVREPDALGEEVAGRVRVLDTLLSDHLTQRSGLLTSKLVVLGARAEQSVFDPGIRLICPGKTPVAEVAGALPPLDDRETGNPAGSSRFALRQKVDDIVGEAKDASGSFQGSYNRQRTTDLDGATTTTKTVSVRGAAGVRLAGDGSRSWVFGYGDYALNEVRKRTAPVPTPAANDGRAKDIDVLEFGLLGSIPVGGETIVARLNGRAGAILDFTTGSRRLVAGARLEPILINSLGPPDRAFCNFGSYSDNFFGLPIEARCAIGARIDVAEVLRAGTATLTRADELVALGGDIGWEFRPRLLEKDNKPRDGLVGGVTYRYQRMVLGRAPDIDRIEAALKYRWWAGDLAIDFGLSYIDGTEPKSLVDENKIALTLGLTY